MHPYFIAMSKPRVDIWIVCVSLHLDDTIIKDRLISNIQDICHLRYFVWLIPMISKIQRLSEFLFTARVDIFDCHPCVKNYVSYLFHLLVQYKHLTLS